MNKKQTIKKVFMDSSMVRSPKDRFSNVAGQWCRISVRVFVLAVSVRMLAAAGYADGLDIVRDGQSMSIIVIPEKPLDCERNAAKELRYHIQKASGATLEVVGENVSQNNTKSRIYLGACTATRTAGIDTSKLSRNGFVIRTIGSNLFLAGRDMPGPEDAEKEGKAGTLKNIPIDDFIEEIGTGAEHVPDAGTLHAVYNFLNREMGVRWLWPGELGEMVPKALTIHVENINRTTALPLRSSLFHPSFNRMTQGWSTEQARRKFHEDEERWLQRHGFSWDAKFRSQHSFQGYWDRFSTSHPEYFNQLPDGTRRPDPYYVTGGNGIYVGMCVSSPALHQQVVEDWKANRKNPMKIYIYAGENDTPGCCCCPECMNWDVPDKTLDIPWDQRLDYARKAFSQKDPLWTRYLGSLSDRYSKFYLAVQKCAMQVDPDVLVQGFAYANYTKAPINTKLNDHVVIHFVPTLMYPWTAGKIEDFTAAWNGWADTGAKMMLRPNFMLDGHCMPIYFARQFGNIFSECYRRSMIGTEFDSRTGQYGVQGPNLYVLARMHTVIDKPVEEILDEYYSAFGSAQNDIRKYFQLWEKVSNAATEEMISESKEGDVGAIFSGWNLFYLSANNIFTPETMGQGKAILDHALNEVKDQPLYTARVEFLQKGLKHAELTLMTQRAYEQSKEGGNEDEFKKSLERLDEYRRSIENDNIANMGYLVWAENERWKRSGSIVENQPQED